MADFDADGDNDAVLVGNLEAWFMENLGENSFSQQKVISFNDDLDVGEAFLFPNHLSPLSADVDGDGDLDLFNEGVELGWLSNHLAADADDDGHVDFEDFLVLSANFEKVDAVWANGDFNGDSLVSFEDFLILSANYGNSRAIRGF